MECIDGRYALMEFCFALYDIARVKRLANCGCYYVRVCKWDIKEREKKKSTCA